MDTQSPIQTPRAPSMAGAAPCVHLLADGALSSSPLPLMMTDDWFEKYADGNTWADMRPWVLASNTRIKYRMLRYKATAKG